MPIYAYRCTSCGHAQDVLRKISDPPLVVCPACGAPTFVKQVTAAGFQLKGSGWYVTDFRDGKKPAKPGDAGKEGANGASDAPAGDAAKSDAAKPADGAPASAPKAGAAAAAPAPAPAPAAAPSGAASGDKGKA
jgi:putative FmdB family regulatory protein